MLNQLQVLATRKQLVMTTIRRVYKEQYKNLNNPKLYWGELRKATLKYGLSLESMLDDLNKEVWKDENYNTLKYGRSKDGQLDTSRVINNYMIQALNVAGVDYSELERKVMSYYLETGMDIKDIYRSF